MKKLLKYLLTSAVAICLIASCKKEENKVYFEGGTSPVLQVSSEADILLARVNAANQALAFTWTNPDYKFNTGISSQDVVYTLQMDTTGSNFTNPNIQEASIAGDLRKAITVKELNDYLTKLGLADGIKYNMEFRVKSTVAGGAIPLFSNIIKIKVTPYFDVVYPVPLKLYITGGATPLSWQCACPTEPDGEPQRFTKIGLTTFELKVKLTANESYLFIPVYSSWNAKYGGVADKNMNNVTGDDFKPDGNDLKAPATTGMYKIVVEFKTGKFTLTPQ